MFYAFICVEYLSARAIEGFICRGAPQPQSPPQQNGADRKRALTKKTSLTVFLEMEQRFPMIHPPKTISASWEAFGLGSGQAPPPLPSNSPDPFSP